MHIMFKNELVHDFGYGHPSAGEFYYFKGTTTSSTRTNSTDTNNSVAATEVAIMVTVEVSTIRQVLML